MKITNIFLYTFIFLLIFFLGNISKTKAEVGSCPSFTTVPTSPSCKSGSVSSYYADFYDRIGWFCYNTAPQNTNDYVSCSYNKFPDDGTGLCGSNPGDCYMESHVRTGFFSGYKKTIPLSSVSVNSSSDSSSSTEYWTCQGISSTPPTYCSISICQNGANNPPTCDTFSAVNCKGDWAASCIDEIQTYHIASSASNGGLPCDYEGGATRSCVDTCSVPSSHYNCIDNTLISTNINSTNFSKWYWRCPNPSSNNPDQGITYSQCSELKPLPNLTTSISSPATATEKVAQSYTATITNSTAPMGKASNYFFQVASSANGGGTITNKTSGTLANLAAGETATATLNHTFASVGTYSMRACADKTSSAGGGVITESNEGDNCGSWTDVVVVSAGMSGTLTYDSLICVIPTGSNVCSNKTLKWSITNPKSALTAITANDMSNVNVAFTLDTPQEGYKSVPGPSYGNPRTYYLYNSAIELNKDKELKITARCDYANGWDPTAGIDGKGACVAPTGTITSTGCKIKVNESYCYANLSWNVKNPPSNSAVTIKNNMSWGSPILKTIDSTSNPAIGSFDTPINFGSNPFYLAHSTLTKFADTTANASCENSTTWDTSVKICKASVGSTLGELTVKNLAGTIIKTGDYIPYNSKIQISWATSVSSCSCTYTDSVNITEQNCDTKGFSGKSPFVPSSALKRSTEYTISCGENKKIHTVLVSPISTKVIEQ